MSLFHGVLPVLPTPFRRDRIELAPLLAYTDRLVAAGAVAVVALGSTSEGPSLRVDERARILEALLGHTQDRIPVLVGVSAIATQQAVEWTQEAAVAGAAGVMLTPPLYWRPRPREVVVHYQAVADVGLPVLVYNNPAASGVDLAPETIAELARHPRIVCVKESSGDPSRVANILTLTDGGIEVVCGSDHLVLDALLCGAVGWVSGAVNLFPEAAVRLWTACREADFGQAAAIYRSLSPTLTLLETSGQYVQLIKAGLAEQGAMGSATRAPLLPADRRLAARLTESLPTDSHAALATTARGGMSHAV